MPRLDYKPEDASALVLALCSGLREAASEKDKETLRGMLRAVRATRPRAFSDALYARAHARANSRGQAPHFKIGGRSYELRSSRVDSDEGTYYAFLIEARSTGGAHSCASPLRSGYFESRDAIAIAARAWRKELEKARESGPSPLDSEREKSVD